MAKPPESAVRMAGEKTLTELEPAKQVRAYVQHLMDRVKRLMAANARGETK